MIFDLETLFGPRTTISISLSDEVERSFSKRRRSPPLWLSSLKLCTCVGGDRRFESERVELRLESES